MHFTFTNTLIFASALLLSACSSVSLDNKVPIEDRSSTKKNGEVGANSGTTQLSSKSAVIDARSVETVTATTPKVNLNAADIPTKRSIYFDYDSFTVKSEFKHVVEMHAKYLVVKKTQKIIIQGNTDERGGREYNLALGQKRAEAVRKSLSLLNVPESQMEAVSFGEEKPKARGSDEASWAENRRADIIYH